MILHFISRANPIPTTGSHAIVGNSPFGSLITIILFALAIRFIAKLFKTRTTRSVGEKRASGVPGAQIKKEQGTDWPYFAKNPLTETEQILYWRLVEALPNKIILSQVQLSQILGVKKGYNHHEWWNKINRMSVDFLICNKDSSIITAIELDDWTHARNDRKVADAKKDKALHSANIEILRLRAEKIPSISDLKTLFTAETNEAGSQDDGKTYE
ncbi:MAG: DUF2726 domain-containing protein [Actinomycetes bacterium]